MTSPVNGAVCAARTEGEQVSSSKQARQVGAPASFAGWGGGGAVSEKDARMEDQDRVSQASSSATVSFLPIRDKCHDKVQTFGKRCQAAKRDPNCPVVIRGWLYKRDNSGLKLWKRRWFVLSNFCLYYYKERNGQTATKLTRVQTEPTLLDLEMTGIKMKTPELRGRHGSRPSTAEANEQSPSLVEADEEHLSFHHLKAAFKQPPFPRDQYGSPCHGTMGRADVWPFDNCSSAPLSPYIYTERGHVPDQVCAVVLNKL
ncbi:hypothetical protein PO909_017479 [Leuciscus waleckii]